MPEITLGDPPISGLGDRFSAWLSLFAMARLRAASVVLPDTSWAKIAHSHQANQNRDMSAALDCLMLPSYVRRTRSWHPHGSLPTRDDTGRLLEPIFYSQASSKRAFFKRGVVLPHPVPGFPQWAIPELAAGSFRKLIPQLSNLTLSTYLDTLRGVARELRVRPTCVPSDAASRFPETHAGERRQDTPEILRTRVIRLCLHLRRRDAWSAIKPANDSGRTTRYVRSISEELRESFSNRTKVALAHIIRSIDEDALVSTSREGTRAGPAARWLIVSDDVEAAAEYERLIVTTSRAGQTAWVVPDGYAVYSFLAMRKCTEAYPVE